MTFGEGLAKPRVRLRYFCLAVALFAVGPLTSEAKAEEFNGPSFRKGMWHFVRTLDLIAHRKNKHRILEREATRCVDPTVSMKATFASPAVGNCVSAKPEKSDNKYTFSNRCDYMGPVSTVITVHSAESYEEVNELTVGQYPRTELVVAHRVGDCQEGAQSSDAQSSGQSSVQTGGPTVEATPPLVAHAVGR
jgi:hypothetical protein